MKPSGHGQYPRRTPAEVSDKDTPRGRKIDGSPPSAYFNTFVPFSASPHQSIARADHPFTYELLSERWLGMGFGRSLIQNGEPFSVAIERVFFSHDAFRDPERERARPFLSEPDGESVGFVCPDDQ
jgi:hypothetical protein